MVVREWKVEVWIRMASRDPQIWMPQLSFKTLQYHNLPSFLAYSLFYKTPLHTGCPELHAGLEIPHTLSYLHVSVFDLGLEHILMYIYTQTYSHYMQKLPFSALALGPVFIWHCVWLSHDCVKPENSLCISLLPKWTHGPANGWMDKRTEVSKRAD